MAANPFRRAEKSASNLRMAIAGPSGSGKTMTSLLIATGLANGRPIAVIDTERGSASKYADQFVFDVLELDSFHPDRYIEAIEAAAAAGYAVLIIDSLSHAWNGTGGALELHDQAVRRQKTQNSYTAWADITPLQNRLVGAITGAPLHVIATMRAKTEYVQEKDDRGSTKIRKVGMAPIQREGMEYEYDIFGQLDLDHNLIVEKSRCPALSGAVIARPDARLAETLNEWLGGGTMSDKAPIEPHVTPLPNPLPKWQALEAEALKLGVDAAAWRLAIRTQTGKSEGLTTDDKITMIQWLDTLKTQLEATNARTPALETLGVGAAIN